MYPKSDYINYFIRDSSRKNELKNFRKELFDKFNRSEVDGSLFSVVEQAEANQRMNEFKKKLRSDIKIKKLEINN
jgi:hypothetical protein